MFETIEEHYRIAYEENLALDSAQMDSVIARFCDADFSYGEKGESFNLGNIGTSDPKEVDDKYGDLPEETVKRRRRWGHFSVWDDGKIIEGNIDKARQVADPTNEIVTAMKAGLARRQDAAVYNMMIGTTYEGKNGTTSKALPAAQKIAVANHDFDSGSGDAKLTLGKIIKARTMLKSQHVKGKMHIAAPAHQISNLLAFEDKMTSADYAAVKALVAGEIDTFFGFQFHEYEYVSTDGSNDELCVAWVEPAVCFRQRVLEAPEVWKRRDKRPFWYAYYQVDQAALRREDVGVVQIACSPAA